VPINLGKVAARSNAGLGPSYITALSGHAEMVRLIAADFTDQIKRPPIRELKTARTPGQSASRVTSRQGIGITSYRPPTHSSQGDAGDDQGLQLRGDLQIGSKPCHRDRHPNQTERSENPRIPP